MVSQDLEVVMLRLVPAVPKYIKLVMVREIYFISPLHHSKNQNFCYILLPATSNDLGLILTLDIWYFKIGTYHNGPNFLQPHIHFE